MTEMGIGARARRKEDRRFLIGKGNYCDDLNRQGQAHAYFLRSQVAHAEIKKVDTSQAAKAPGVVAIYTGADVAADNLGGLPCGWGITGKGGAQMHEPPRPILAQGKVRHVGEPIAVVIAETKKQAREAAALIEVSLSDLPAVASIAAAIKTKSPVVHDVAPGNVAFDWEIGDAAAVTASFAKAHHVTKIDLVNNRLIPNAIEPRVALAEYDAGTGDYTLHVTSQNPHVHRLLMCAFILHIPEHKFRVVAPDVGGGFGSKIFTYHEESVVTWVAGKLARPVKWTSDRSEAFMSDAHGRDHVTHA